MARIRVDEAGSVGLVEDNPEIELAPEGWSMLQNMRAGPLGLERILGETLALGTSASSAWGQPTGIAGPVYGLFLGDTPTSKFWIGAGQRYIVTRQQGPTWTEQDVTRAAGVYAATEDLKWNGIRFQGFIVLTNGVDQPQWWAPAVGTKFQNLSAIGVAPDAWVATHICRLMRNIGPYMIALDVTKAGVRNPYMVKWSSPSIAGAMPPSWDATNAAEQANEYSLVESALPTGAGGSIIAAERLRNSLIIYKQNEFYSMNYVGGIPVMSFTRGIFAQGALAAQCVANFGEQQELHFVVSTDDVFVHNGQSPTSIVSQRLRRWLFNEIDVNYYQRSFVVANPNRDEVWFCYPERGATQPTQALIWNTKNGAIGVRDLCKVSTTNGTRSTVATQGVYCAATGPVTNPNGLTCDIMLAPANSYTILCSQTEFNATQNRLLFADRSSNYLIYMADQSTAFENVAFTAQAERLSLTIAQQSRGQQPKADLESIKLCTELWPRVIAQAGTVVEFAVGAQEWQQGDVTWTDWMPFTVGTDEKVDVYISGRLLAVKMRSITAFEARLTGYELVVEPVGTW